MQSHLKNLNFPNFNQIKLCEQVVQANEDILPLQMQRGTTAPPKPKLSSPSGLHARRYD
jgi:hypothetical protein